MASVAVLGGGVGGDVPLPGEHGFRFFPGFYQHLDTLALAAKDRVDHVEVVVQIVHRPGAARSGRDPEVEVDVRADGRQQMLGWPLVVGCAEVDVKGSKSRCENVMVRRVITGGVLEAVRLDRPINDRIEVGDRLDQVSAVFSGGSGGGTLGASRLGITRRHATGPSSCRVRRGSGYPAWRRPGSGCARRS
ncbi:hypothetical protein CIW52_03655 [Mycolicibacterium sp. P9-64]|nr:hypothetical protein CIW52_03655 [Mycolicibacterium sp. P9-64]